MDRLEECSMESETWQKMTAFILEVRIKLNFTITAFLFIYQESQKNYGNATIKETVGSSIFTNSGRGSFVPIREPPLQLQQLQEVYSTLIPGTYQ